MRVLSRGLANLSLGVELSSRYDGSDGSDGEAAQALASLRLLLFMMSTQSWMSSTSFISSTVLSAALQHNTA